MKKYRLDTVYGHLYKYDESSNAYIHVLNTNAKTLSAALKELRYAELCDYQCACETGCADFYRS